MNTHESPFLMKYIGSRYTYRWLFCIFILSMFRYKATAKGVSQRADQHASVKETKSKTIKKVISNIKDEDLQDFMLSISRNGQNPYPEVELDLWLLKAIEEPKHELTIVKYMMEKGLITKSLPWFSKIDRQDVIDFPMHRAAYLGKVDIVQYLLQQGVTKYDQDDIFILALKGGSAHMVRFLLKNKIFDEDKLYGLVPSIMPQFLTYLFFSIIVPFSLWLAEKYKNDRYTSALPFLYLKLGSFAVSVMILLYILLDSPKDITEGIGYLHILSTVSVKDDIDGTKASNIAEIAKLLLLYGANPNQKGSYIQELGVAEIKKIESFTPLHVAVKRGNLPLVKVLIEYGGDVNAVAYLKCFERGGIMSKCEDEDFLLYLPFWCFIEAKILAAYTPLDFAHLDKQKEVYTYLTSLKGIQRARHYKNLLNFLS